MLRPLLFALTLILAAPAALAGPPSPLLGKRPLVERPQIMVLGMVHLANPNRDVHNAQVDDVLAPKRQAEIVRLVDILATWKPTHIAVEWPHSDQAGLDKRYADYRAGRLKLTANERDQLALRLAAKLDLPRVDAVDWNENFPGKDEDYDWPAGAKAAHEEARYDALRDPKVDEEETELIRTHTVAGFLRVLNRPASLLDMHRAYYDIAMMGTPENNVGANWVGGWYGRNLKIFTNLVRLNARPDERILVFYGAGHGYFLNTFAEESHAFRLVRPDALLAKAEKSR